MTKLGALTIAEERILAAAVATNAVIVSGIQRMPVERLKARGFVGYTENIVGSGRRRWCEIRVWATREGMDSRWKKK
jgi:hypothetical protein